MRSYPNIENRKLSPSHNYYVGYVTNGHSIRIYGSSGSWLVNCQTFRTLSEVSAYLATI